MTKAWILTIPLVLVVGCRRGEEFPPPLTGGEQGEPPGGMWEEYEPPGEGTQPSEGAQPTDPGMGEMGRARPGQPAAGELGTVIENIRAAPELAPGDVAMALRNVATELEQLASTDGTAQNLPQAVPADIAARITSIRGLADQIEMGDPASPDTTTLARSAMEESMTALQTMATNRGIQDFDPQVQNMRSQMEALRPDQPLTQQKDAVVESLQQIADSMNYIGQRPATGTQ